MKAYEVTLVSGSATITVPFRTVHLCLLTQKGTSATAEGLAWSFNSSTKVVTITSSDASSTSTISVLVIGRI